MALALVAAACSFTPGGSSSGGGAKAATTTIATTSPAQPAAPYYPVWVDFPAPGRAWGLFWEQYSAQGCAMLVARQASPGVFVAPATFGHFLCGHNMGVADVVSDGQGDVFAYGPELFVSHNAGKSFTPDPQAGSVLAVSTVGGSIWMLEALCPAAAKQSAVAACPLKLFISNDGGRTFGVDSHLPPAVVRSGSVLQGPGLRATWLQRPSAKVGYVFVPPLFGAALGAPAPNQESVYRSRDGGASWTQSSIGGCANAFYAVASVNPQGQAMVICAGQPSAGFQPKSVFVNSSDGLQWVTRADCLGVTSPCASTQLNNGYLGMVAFISPTTAFAGGGRSPLLVSHDGGASWQLVPGVGSNGGDTYSAAFFGSRGYVFGDQGSVSQSYIWTTTDSGAVWDRTAVRIAG